MDLIQNFFIRLIYASVSIGIILVCIYLTYGFMNGGRT